MTDLLALTIAVVYLAAYVWWRRSRRKRAEARVTSILVYRLNDASRNGRQERNGDA